MLNLRQDNIKTKISYKDHIIIFLKLEQKKDQSVFKDFSTNKFFLFSNYVNVNYLESFPRCGI